MRNYDLDILKRFSMVIAFLALVTQGLILVAHHQNGSVATEADSAAVRNTAARIAPVGEVYAGATGAAQQAEAMKAAAAAAASQVAYGGTTDGKTIYVSNEDDGEASFIDFATGKQIKSVKVGGEPEGVLIKDIDITAQR